MSTFANEPLLELRREAVRREALAALAALDAKLPLEVPMLIGEDVVTAAASRPSTRASPTRIVAHAHEATARTSPTPIARAEARPQGVVAQARRRARRRALARRRTSCARAASSSPRSPSARPASRGPRPTPTSARRSTSSSTTRTARSRSTAAAPLLQLPGERNAMRYVARGVTGVIAPWNFPLAIAAGMVCAALATGNAVVLKPAEQAPGVRQGRRRRAARRRRPARRAAACCPGGDEAGKALVADPRIHTIVFTGSCAVGLQILERAAKVVPGQRHLKRVIAEMGGKNASSSTPTPTSTTSSRRC